MQLKLLTTLDATLNKKKKKKRKKKENKTNYFPKIVVDPCVKW